MRSQAEVRNRLARHDAWINENGDSGAAEVGAEVGAADALSWVLGDGTYDDIDRAIDYAERIQRCRAAQNELKIAFVKRELDGGAKAAMTHPLFLRLQAEIDQAQNLMVHLVGLN